MQKFTIEISGYPQQFIVAAKDKNEAITLAAQRWYSKTNGASIYESRVVESEPISDNQ